MKSLISIVLFVAVVSAGLYFLYPEKLREWTEGTPLAPPAPSTTFYKWKDSAGNPVVTNKPPEMGIPYEAVEYRHDLNLMPLPEKLREQ